MNRRDYFEWLKDTKSPEVKRMIRERLNYSYEPVRYTQSIAEAPRTIYTSEETWVTVGIYDAEGMTDEEIREALHEEYDSMQIHSPYDCTGRAFMSGYHWQRVAIGLVVIKWYALDI